MRVPTRAKVKEKKGSSKPRKDSSGVQSGQRPACFFYPKGTCTRGKDCPFEHVDAPKAAAPPCWQPRRRARVLATSLHPNVRGFRATCRLITAPFRVFARFAAAFSFALPATVHHSHDRIAATVSRPNCSGGSYFLDWVADSGAGRSLLSQSALAEQGIVTDMFKDHIQSTKSLQFETGNGVTSSGTFLTTTSDAFGSVESYILQSCPVVRSLGQLVVELQRKPFVWLPGSMPFFGTDEDCIQITWDSDRVIYAHKVDDFVPVFREQIKFGGDGLHRALAAGESAPAAPAEEPAPADDPLLNPLHLFQGKVLVLMMRVRRTHQRRPNG